jgi:biopolymer transport protein ExbD
MALKLSHGDDGDLEEAHEINVTPFIDVMLVLLIIFMVAAPLATVDVKVDLPASTTKPTPRPDKPVFVTVKAGGELALDDQVVTEEALPALLDARTGGNRDERLFLRADKTVDYDTLMRTLNRLRDTGYLKVALVGLEAGAGS